MADDIKTPKLATTMKLEVGDVVYSVEHDVTATVVEIVDEDGSLVKTSRSSKPEKARIFNRSELKFIARQTPLGLAFA